MEHYLGIPLNLNLICNWTLILDDETNVNLNLNANSEESGVEKLDILESRAQAATEILDPIIRNFILDFEIGK